MDRYYISFIGAAVFVKEAEFFKSQGGLTQEWGKDWVWCEADGIEHARLIGRLHFQGSKSVKTGDAGWIYVI